MAIKLPPLNVTMDLKNWENFGNNSTMDLRIGEILEITLPCTRSARNFLGYFSCFTRGNHQKRGPKRGPRLARFFGNNSTMKQELRKF